MVKTSLFNAAVAAAFASGSVQAFSATANNNYALYWGQDSYGAAGGASSGYQKNLASYCTDSTVDIFVLAFMDIFFDSNSLPEIDFANADANCTTFPGTNLLNCPQLGADIATCQAAGKKVLLSLGGASGSYGFSSDSQAQGFADTLWNLFGAGSSSTRPFGNTVIDGYDLDIEGGGATGYAAFINQMRGHYASDSSRQYYISGAPQCPYPDAYLGTTLDSAWFDFVFVQFYNNYCSVSGGQFNFDTWDNWAKSTAPNPNVRVFLGLPGSTTAAGSGYVPYSTLQSTISSTGSQYSSFGGVMMWDTSQAYANTEVSPNLAEALGSFLHSGVSSGGGGSSTTASPTTTPTKTTTSPTSTPTGSTCPSAGGACSTGFACSGSQFAQCDNGKWVLTSCSSGQICQFTSDGSSIYCDIAAGHTEYCSGSASTDSPSIPVTNSKAAQVAFVVNSADISSTQYSALFNVRAQGSKAIGGSWTLAFQVSNDTLVSSSNVGKVTQNGNMVTISANRQKVPAESEAVVVSIAGSKSANQPFTGVDPSTINFSY